MRQADLMILLVAKRSGRSGDSLLKSIPLQANIFASLFS